LNDPNFKGALLFTKGLSAEGIARGCKHAITRRGRRYIDYVIRGPAAIAAT
jgi:hypothetical protein